MEGASHCKLLFMALLMAVRAKFRAQVFNETTVPCNASLSTKVPFSCRGKVFKYAKLDVWAKNLDFSFGKISKGNFDSLKQQYTAPWAGPQILSGATPVFDTHDPDKTYNLLDFLPMTIRGLVDYTFIEEDEPLASDWPRPSPKPDGFHIYKDSIMVPNCWGTVYETMRAVTLGRGDNTTVFHDVYSTGDRNAMAWLDVSTSRMPGEYTEVERKFGDAMFIYLLDKQFQRPVLEHAVIFVDNDVIFEKAGTGDLNPYRLTSVTTLEMEWKPVQKGGLYTWYVHRPHFGPEQAKSFTEQFSLASAAVDQRWPELWTWPENVKEWLTLGVSDNPRNISEIFEITMLKARRYEFCQNDGRWTPCLPAVARSAQTLIV